MKKIRSVESYSIADWNHFMSSCCWSRHFDTPVSGSSHFSALLTLQQGSALLSVDNRRLYCFKEAQRTLKRRGITVPLREGWGLRLGNLLQSWG